MCKCGGYPFPHRKGGGKCMFNPFIMIDEEEQPAPKPKRGRKPKNKAPDAPIAIPAQDNQNVKVILSQDEDTKKILKDMFSSVKGLVKTFDSTFDAISKMNGMMEVVKTDVSTMAELLKSTNQAVETKELADTNRLSQDEVENRKYQEKSIELLEAIEGELVEIKDIKPVEAPKEKTSILLPLLKGVVGGILKPITGIMGLLKKLPGLGTAAKFLGGASILSNIFGGSREIVDGVTPKKESLLKRAAKAPLKMLGGFFGSPIVGLGSLLMGGVDAYKDYKKGGDFSSIVASFAGGVTEFLTGGLINNKDVKKSFKEASEKLSDWMFDSVQGASSAFDSAVLKVSDFMFNSIESIKKSFDSLVLGISDSMTLLADGISKTIEDTITEFQNRLTSLFEGPKEKEARTEKLRAARETTQAKQKAATPMGGYEASVAPVPEKIKLDTMVASIEKNPQAREEYRKAVISKGKELGIGFEEALSSNKIDRFAIAQEVSGKYEDVKVDYSKSIEKAKPEPRGTFEAFKSDWGRPRGNKKESAELEMVPTLNPNVVKPSPTLSAEPVVRGSLATTAEKDKKINIVNSFNQTAIAPSSQNNISSPLTSSNPGKKLASGE